MNALNASGWQPGTPEAADGAAASRPSPATAR